MSCPYQYALYDPNSQGCASHYLFHQDSPELSYTLAWFEVDHPPELVSVAVAHPLVIGIVLLITQDHLSVSQYSPQNIMVHNMYLLMIMLWMKFA